MFTVGQCYTRDEISTWLGGSTVYYLPFKQGQVVCGCFRMDRNPDAPKIILPGTGPIIQGSAEIFRKQNKPIPVFIKKDVNAWEYIGDYQVKRSTTSPSVIAKHAKRSRRTDITRVLYLKGKS